MALIPALLMAVVGATGDIRVDTFREVCVSARANYATSRTAAVERGWTVVDGTQSAELQTVMRTARTAHAQGTVVQNLEAFGRGEGSVYVMLSELVVDGTRVNGCYVYDFEASGAVPASAFADLLPDPPSDERNIEGVLMTQKWDRPRLLSGVVHIRSGYIPSGSPAVQSTGFDGLALTVTSVSVGVQ